MYVDRLSGYGSGRNVAPGHPALLWVRSPCVPLCPSPGGALLLCGILLFMRRVVFDLPQRWRSSTARRKENRFGTIPPARFRGPPCRLRLSFHTREAPKVRTFAGRYGKCDHLLFKAFFPPGRWSLTSLPDGERLASKPGTRACERDGRSVPTRVTPSASVPSAPPSGREVKDHPPYKKQ